MTDTNTQAEELLIYEKIKKDGESREHVRIYELGCKLYYSRIVVTPYGAHGHHRLASSADHAIATLALVEQLNLKIEH